MINQDDLYVHEMEKNILGKPKDIRNNYLKMKYYNEHKMFEQIVNDRVFPYKADIEPTTRCFLNCRYCQVPYWERNKLPDLSLEDFKKIIDNMPYLLELKLQGQGEPLLNKQLFDMVKYASSKNILVRFNTNGMLLNEERIQAILEVGLFELRVSMDGASKESNYIMRKGLCFQKVVDNISLLMRKRGSRTTPLVNVWMLLTNNNINELKEMVDLCTAMGVDGLKVQTKLSTRDDFDIEKKVMEDTIDINTSVFQNIIAETKEKAKKSGLDLEIITNKWRTKENPCWWLWNSAYISSDGYVVPCSIINDPAKINFGNIKDRSFYDIWESDEYNEFRKKTLQLNICKLCKWCYKV